MQSNKKDLRNPSIIAQKNDIVLIFFSIFNTLLIFRKQSKPFYKNNQENVLMF